MRKFTAAAIILLAAIGAASVFIFLGRAQRRPSETPPLARSVQSDESTDPAPPSAPPAASPTARPAVEAFPLPAALAVVPIEGGAAGANPCGSLVEPGCSPAQVEAMVGFKPFMPEKLPPGMTFAGALADPVLKSSILVYRCGAACTLTISQRPCSNVLLCCQPGDPDKDKTIAIGGHNGTFRFAASWKSLEWPQPVGSHHNHHNLRIDVLGSPDPSSGLDRDGLIALAEHTGRIEPPTGLIAYETTRDGNPEIYVMEYRKSRRANLTNHPAADHSFAWSPDGKRIAFLSDRSGSLEVYVMRADGSDLTRLTTGSRWAWHGRPAWSPGEAQLAMVGRFGQEGEGLIHIINTDGSGRRLASAEPVLYPARPQWSPDGKWIAFIDHFFEDESSADPQLGHSNVRAVDVAGGTYAQLSADDLAPVGSYAWSPEGQALAYSRNGDLVLANADGSDPEIVPVNYHDYRSSSRPLSAEIAWSPDGKRIAFQTQWDKVPGDLESSIYLALFDLASRQKTGLNTFYLIDKAGGLSWSPQGRQIVTGLHSRQSGGAVRKQILAWLIDDSIPNLSPPLMIDLTTLETARGEGVTVANPQWQPQLAP